MNDFLKLLFIFVLLLKEADRINQPEFIIVNVKIIEVKPSNSILTRVKLRDVQSSMLNWYLFVTSACEWAASLAEGLIFSLFTEVNIVNASPLLKIMLKSQNFNHVLVPVELTLCVCITPHWLKYVQYVSVA